jgi:enterochelin esterase-like enzyme
VGLTSPALSYLLAIVATGLLLGVIAGWRRLAGPGLRAVALRAGTLVALQVVVLALIFVIVNRAGVFYSSWSDLFGSDTATAAVTTSSGTGDVHIRPVAVISQSAVKVPGDKAAGGTLQTVRLDGQLSGLSVLGYVFLPAGYRSTGPAGHYPVVVVISDDLDTASSPYDAVRLAEQAATLIAARQLDPMLLVMLPASLSPTDEACLNEPPHAAASGVAASPAVLAGTFFTEDLPTIMETRYAASDSAVNWGLLGDASGGYCALQLALSNSWVFSAAVAPDGSSTAPPGSPGVALSPQLKQQDNLLWLLRNQPMQPVSVLLTGSSLTSGAGQAEPFAALAQRPMRVTTMALSGGSSPLSSVLTWIGAAVGQHQPVLSG